MVSEKDFGALLDEDPVSLDDLPGWKIIDCNACKLPTAMLIESDRGFCFRCITSLTEGDPDFVDDLAIKAKAREAWNGSRTVRAFAKACRP
jgi:hypothetical protein